MLLILLCISLVALIGTEIYKHFTSKESTSVRVPENYIIPEEGGNTDNQIENTENNTGTDNSNSSNEDNTTTESNGSNDSFNNGSNNGSNEGSNDDSNDDSNEGSNDDSNDDSNGGSNDDSSGGSNDDSNSDSSDDSNDSDSDSSKPTSTVISLHKGQFTDNEPFKVINMLPGDSEVKNFCLKVSYKNSGTIKFLVDIHNKPEKLLEVLKLKVVLLNSGDVLYDGLVRDMGELETYTLKKSDTAKTEELYYEISTYLDTSVGNEYMDSKELKADFKWWVDEKANLVRAPGKLDYSNVALALSFITGSLLILKLLPKKHKK